MKNEHLHPEITTRSAIRRSSRLHSWMVVAFGVHLLLATAASASDISVTAAERTKVRRISGSVVQVIRELVDRQSMTTDREPTSPGFRLVDSCTPIASRQIVASVRMLGAMLTDLPPPMRI